jgi:hypothetical protein
VNIRSAISATSKGETRLALAIVLLSAACSRHRPASPDVRPAASVDAVAVPDARPVDDGECGYVDKTGQFAIGRRFDRVGEFSSGLAAVSKHRKVGFIDTKGDYAIAPSFDEAKPFHDGVAAACVSGKGWGFIDAKGQWVIPPGFEYADAFVDGVAVVKTGDDLRDACEILLGREVPAGSECGGELDNDDDGGEVGRYFLIDRTGKRMHDKGYRCITRMSEGLAAARRNEKWGYLGRDGREAIAPRFVRAKPFGEGWAAVYMTDRVQQEPGTEGEGRWGFIDRRGRFVTQVKFRAEDVGVFSQGLVAMEGVPAKSLASSPIGRACLSPDRTPDDESTSACGVYLDKKGTIRLAVPYCFFSDGLRGYRSLRDFSGGLAEVVMEEPLQIKPFACAPAMMVTVRAFVDLHGNFEPVANALLRRSPEGLIPKCRAEKSTLDVRPFVWDCQGCAP